MAAADIRLQLVRELISSKIHYVKALQGALQAYQVPLEREQVLSAADVGTLFANADQLLEFSKRQCVALRDRVQQWSPAQCVGDVFVASGELWHELHAAFVHAYPLALRRALELQRTNAKFANMAKGAGHGAPPLLEALALPLGHLCRFHVLLFQLLRRTDAGHPDYENLEAAVDAVNILIGELDETCTPLVRCRERAAQLQALVATIERDVELPSVRTALNGARQKLRPLVAHYVVSARGSVPHRADQLNDWHVTVNDTETVLTQLRLKPGALDRVRQSGLPPALAKRFDAFAAKITELFDGAFANALAAARSQSPQQRRSAAGAPAQPAQPQQQSAPAASSPQESAKRPPGGVQRASSSRAMQQRRASAAQAALEAAKTRMAGGGGAAGGARRASAVPGSSPGGFAQAQSLSSSSGFGGGTMPFEKPPLVSRGSMIGASNGVASVIEDDEGQLMWVETFGRAVRVVPCDKFFEGLEVFLDQKLNDGERKLLHYVINMGQPEQMEIDVDLFSGFLKGFGPLTSSLTNVKSILGSNWFYGFLSHSEAIRLLETEPIGTYLVRFSLSKPGSFALEATILDANGQPFVLPIQINSTPDGGFAIHESETGDREFGTLHELISYYTAYLLQPLDSTIPFEIWFHGDISSADAAAALAGQPEGTFLLRFSSRAGCYASSFVEEGQVRHALILSVDGGYVVEGDNHIYGSVPELVLGFSAGLQKPLVHPVQKRKQEIFAIAEQELKRELESAEENDKYTIDSSERGQPSSFRDPADLSAGKLPAARDDGAAAAAASAASGSTSPRAKQAAEELVYMPDSKAIKGGTLEGLTAHLLENTAGKFAKTFLLTYGSFTTPGELLGLLQQRYIRLTETDGGTSIESKKQRLRICNFLKSWAQKHFASATRDDAESDNFVRAFQAFANQRIRPVDGENLAKQLLKTLDRALELARQEDGGGDAAKFVFSAKPPKPQLPKHFDRGDVPWYDVSALEIARQMTLVEEALFRAVRPSELIGLAWTKKDKAVRAPNLLQLISRFNLVSEWVKTTILEFDDLKKRTKIYEKFVEIAVQLGKLNNFNAAMEITSALESAAIFRLKKTKAKVSAKLVAKYDTLHASLSRAQNYKALRAAIHSSNPPIIPYFGMYQSDLTFIEEGNPDLLKDYDPPLINFHKRRLYAQVLIDEVQQYQQAPHNLTKIPMLQELLEKELQKEKLDDDASYKKSLQIEPRE